LLPLRLFWDYKPLVVAQFSGGVFRNANGVAAKEFPNLNVDGCVPPPIMLAVAMHSW
jgi:hypothetical protein